MAFAALSQKFHVAAYCKRGKFELWQLQQFFIVILTLIFWRLVSPYKKAIGKLPFQIQKEINLNEINFRSVCNCAQNSLSRNCFKSIQKIRMFI